MTLNIRNSATMDAQPTKETTAVDGCFAVFRAHQYCIATQWQDTRPCLQYPLIYFHVRPTKYDRMRRFTHDNCKLMKLCNYVCSLMGTKEVAVVYSCFALIYRACQHCRVIH